MLSMQGAESGIGHAVVFPFYIIYVSFSDSIFIYISFLAVYYVVIMLGE